MADRVFILASDYREASLIARLAGFKGSIGWDVLDPFSVRGHHGNMVLMTETNCWRGTMGLQQVEDIRNIIAIGRFKVIQVPCPGSWREQGFHLPEGWREPVVTELSVQRDSLWVRLRRALGR